LQRAQRIRNDNAVLRDIVADNRHPVFPTQAGGTVKLQGAGEVITGNDGAAHSPLPQRGWVDAPKIKPPPGIAVMDRMMDVEAELDLAERKERFRKLRR
jgi:hypothetical protein